MYLYIGDDTLDGGFAEVGFHNGSVPYVVFHFVETYSTFDESHNQAIATTADVVCNRFVPIDAFAHAVEFGGIALTKLFNAALFFLFFDALLFLLLALIDYATLLLEGFNVGRIRLVGAVISICL